MIEELRRGQQQVQQGQQPTAVSQQTASALNLDDKFFDDLTVDNFKDKFAGLIKNVASTLDTKYSTQMNQVLEKNKQLEEQLGKISGDITYKEGLLNFEAHRNRLFSEVEQLQNDPITAGVLKTQWPISKINEVLMENPEQAALILPAGDYEKAGHIMEVLKLYCQTDNAGDVDVSQRRLKSIRAAFAAYNTDAQLNSQDIAAAHTAGQRQVMETMARVANQPPTLPNTMSTTTGLNDMTIDEATQLINTPIDEVKKWEKKSPKKFAQWQKAQEFAANQP
jgi:hypothetical protein